jgi:chemotaxis protein histidine kinase CheA
MTISHKATLARGVLASFVRPRLASDQAMPDLKAVLLGTTAANWPTAKAVVAKRLVAATKGRLAKDASVEEVQALLNCLDGEADNEPDSMDDEPDGMDEEAETEEEKAERMKRRTEAKDKAARDAEGETEEEMRKRHAEELKSAKDKSAKDAEGETEEEKKAKDKAARDRAAKDKARDSEPKPITKEAMDSALAANADQIRREMRAEAHHYQEALEIVKPVLGLVLAQDSADGVFRVLFKHAGVDVLGVPPAAFKALAIQTVKASGTRTEAPRLAADAATVTLFAKKFPSAAAVRRIG